MQKLFLSVELDSVVINHKALVWADFDHFWQKRRSEETELCYEPVCCLSKADCTVKQSRPASCLHGDKRVCRGSISTTIHQLNIYKYPGMQENTKIIPLSQKKKKWLFMVSCGKVMSKHRPPNRMRMTESHICIQAFLHHPVHCCLVF